MNTLALDPGIITGIALLDGNGILLESFAVPFEQLPGTLDSMDFDLRKTRVVREVTPTPTTGKMNEELRKIVGYLVSRFPDSREVRPGQWKQNKLIVNYTFPEWDFPSSMTHQRDAFRLGLYTILFDKEHDAEAESVNDLNN